MMQGQWQMTQHLCQSKGLSWLQPVTAAALCSAGVAAVVAALKRQVLQYHAAAYQIVLCTWDDDCHLDCDSPHTQTPAMHDVGQFVSILVCDTMQGVEQRHQRVCMCSICIKCKNKMQCM